MTEYVVCPACGTRIKAGRGHCLRCFHLLPPPGTVPKPSILASLGWSRPTQVMIGIATALAVAALLAIIWQTNPQPDDAPQSSAAPPRAATATAPFRTIVAPIAAPEARPEPAGRPPNGDELFIDRPRVAVDDGPRDQQVVDHFTAARAAADAYQWTRAIEEYGAAARISPGDAAAQYNLALALHRRGDEREAITTFHKAIALAPDDETFHMPLAAAYENVGQPADAVREYRAFVAARPDAPDADRARGRIEALSTGNPGDGR